MLAKSFLKLDP